MSNERIAQIKAELRRISIWSTRSIILREELEGLGVRYQAHAREEDPETGHASSSVSGKGDAVNS